MKVTGLLAVAFGAALVAASGLAAGTPESASQRAERVLADGGYQKILPGVAGDAQQASAVGSESSRGLRMPLPATARAIADSLAWTLVIAVGTAVVLGLAIALMPHRRRRSEIGEPQPSVPVADDQASDQGAGEARSLAELISDAAWSAAAHRLLAKATAHLDSAHQLRLRRSMTSREILGALEGSESRSDFATLVSAVERSHFGVARLGASEFDQVRSAYQSLTGGQGGAG